MRRPADDPADHDLLARVAPLPRRQIQHRSGVAGVRDLAVPRSGTADRRGSGSATLLPHECRRGARRRAPSLRAASACRWRGTAPLIDARPRALPTDRRRARRCREASRRTRRTTGSARRPADGGPPASFSGWTPGLTGVGTTHERDAARGELAMEFEDRRPRIRLRQRRQLARLRHAPAQHVGLEEAAPGQVLDVRPEEQPSVPADIDALVAGAQPSAEDSLCRRTQRPAQHGFVLDPVFEVEQAGHRRAIRRQRALPQRVWSRPGRARSPPTPAPESPVSRDHTLTRTGVGPNPSGPRSRSPERR